MTSIDAQRECKSRGLTCYYFDDGAALFKDAETNEVVYCDCSTPEEGYFHCEHKAMIQAKAEGFDNSDSAKRRK